MLYRFFWFLFLTLPLRAQYSDLLTNPHISWVAEYTSDFVLNPEDEENLYESDHNYLDVIEFRNPGNENGLYGRNAYAKKYLSQQVLKNTGVPGFPCYQDSLLTTPMSAGEHFSRLNRIDTAWNSCNGEVSFITVEVHYTQIWCFRVRQVFWYDRKTRRFDSRLLSYAPVVDSLDSEGNRVGLRVLYWLKPGDNPPGRFKNRNFSYIFQTRMKNNSPRLQDFKVQKGSLDLKALVREEMQAPAHPCLDAGEYKPADPPELLNYCFGQDTIVTYDPNSNEEQVSIEPRNCLEWVERIRFVHNWYYDERRNRLYARLAGFAPLLSIRDSDGNFRYYRPLFYQMYP